MEQIFITNLTIEKVRHLKDISIPLQKDKIKHLILTGKNGSGKTSVAEALAGYLNNAFTDESFGIFFTGGKSCLDEQRLDIEFNHKPEYIFPLKEKYHYILAYYNADRTFEAEQPRHIEKVQLQDDYGITETAVSEFVKYLLDLKMTEALARSNMKLEKADTIKAWFEKLEQLLKKIFEDETVKLGFDEETFEFSIFQQGKEPFGFNTLSRGYQAVLDIVLDIMMRMQKQAQRSFGFNVPGIVLIDEVEAHLHLELQKNIMPLLTTLFPNIQFIVTSHSPFILNSIENVIIYDLENNLLVKEGLDNIPYDGIVEGYFRAGKMSHILEEKFRRYKYLVKKKNLSDDDINEIAELELYLDEIPDYLAISITTEYQRLKLEFINREDIDG